MLSRFACVLTPDFSCYLDIEPMQRWNVCRGRVVGRALQDAGLTVVPTLTWGEPNTYAFCFEGIPKGSIVALSTVGLMDCDEDIALFKHGSIRSDETASTTYRSSLRETLRLRFSRLARGVVRKRNANKVSATTRKNDRKESKPWAEEAAQAR